MSSMAAHTNANNFAVENRVDPRTGQYGLSIVIPEVVGNGGAGPNLSLSLAYNTMGAGDVGYGEGWDLNLSRFVEHAYPDGGALSLFTGEHFTVDGVDSISEKKLDTFHFHVDDQANGHFRVVNRSGVVEMLQRFGAEKQQVALPTRIYAPTGQWIELSYINNPLAPGWFCLDEVRDGHPDGFGKGRLLLKVTYGGDTVFTRYPGTDVEASHTLKFKGRQLQYAVLPDHSQWAFDYQLVHEQTCVTKVTSPAGAVEHIEYGVDGDPGHALPGVDKKLPRVKRHRVLPGHDQPDMLTVYDYSAENHMGNGSTITWRNNGRDNLYEVVNADYSYWCKTTQSCPGQADRTVTTHYDRFHRTTSEVHIQDKHITRTTMVYHGELADPFANQPAIYLMPKAVTTSWEMEEDASKQRHKTITTEYDPEGNLTKETREDGSSTVLEYYDAKGEAGKCPAEPNGFKKHVKSQTVYPSELDKVAAGAIALRTDFTYKALDILTGSAGLVKDRKLAATWVAIEQEVVSDADKPETPLTTVKREYFTSTTDAQLYGRMSKRETTLHGEHDGKGLSKAVRKVLADKTTTLEWKYGQSRHKVLGDVYQTTQTTTGHNATQKVAIQTQHSLTGHVLENVDIHKTVTRFTYDLLDRLTSETSAPDNAAQRATRTYRYVVNASNNYQEIEAEAADKEKPEDAGVISRVYYDSLNRPIKEVRTCRRIGSETKEQQDYQVYAANYNAFGQLTDETTFDHLDDGRELSMTSRHAYDNWGNRRSTLRPDGITEVTERNPFGTEGDIVTSWEEHDESLERKNQRVITNNRFDKPEHVQTLDEKGDVASTRAFRYDGFGRSVEETFTFRVPASRKQPQAAEHKRVTGYQYDAWGRMKRTDRADGSALSREFATHTNEELTTRINLHPGRNDDGVTVCEREFDDIDRMTSMSIGPYQETRIYDGAQMLPVERVMKSGRTFSYGYDLAVNTSPTQITAGKNQKPSTFKYNQTSANITEAGNEHGVRTYRYTDQGYLLSESWEGTQPGEAYTRSFVTSLQGRMLNNSDSDATAKVYEYDKAGRPCKVTQGALQSVFTYNAAGLLHTTLTTNSADPKSVQQLLCTQTYDDRGRETSRALELSRPEGNTKKVLDERTLDQVWRDDDMLHTRTLLKAGTPVLTESFDYDERDRLYNHYCEGSLLPTNSKGRAITNEMYEFDAYDNILLCFTEFADGEIDEAFYEYFEDSPFQLKSVSHTLTDDYPALVTFTKADYDADGNMLKDEQGNRLHYDEDTGQLARVTNADGTQLLAGFRYDGHGTLMGARNGSEGEELRRYEGYRLSSTLRDGVLTQYLFGGQVPLGLQQSGKGNETRLYMATSDNNVIAECAADNTVHEAGYSAYGEREEGKLLGLLGFNAEAREPVLGWEMRGCGVRAYGPALRRFYMVDNMAPEVAGINPYIYALNNPLKWQDPTGHYATRSEYSDIPPHKEKRGALFWLNIASIVMGAVLTIGFAVVLLPTAGPLAIGLIAAGAAALMASVGTQIAAEFTSDPKKKEKLQTISAALSLVGNLLLVAGMVKGGMDKRAAQKANAGGGDASSVGGGSMRCDSTASSQGQTQRQAQDLSDAAVQTEFNSPSPRNSLSSSQGQGSRRPSDPPVDYNDSEPTNSSNQPGGDDQFVQGGGPQVDINNKPLAPKTARFLNKYGHTVHSHSNGAFRMNTFKDTATRDEFAAWLGG